MDPLLQSVLDAHGGLEAWHEVDELVVQLSLGGPFWAARGHAGILDGQTARIDVRRQRLTFAPFTGSGREVAVEAGPERVVLRDASGGVVDERLEPRATFPLPFDPRATPWDPVQVAYFAGAATWNYLTTPFLLAWPGVVARELEPWREGEEVWRRLGVTFPPGIATHNPSQVFHFGPDLLLRRLDYAPHVTGNPPIAHLVGEQREFGGFVFPTRRRVHLRGATGEPDRAYVAITDDIEHVEVIRR